MTSTRPQVVFLTLALGMCSGCGQSAVDPIADAMTDATPIPDGAPDAEPMVDPRAACAVATTPEECEAITLPAYRDEDGWQRCEWFVQTRVEPGDRACEATAREERCELIVGGKEGYADPSIMCLNPDYAGMVYARRDDGVWVSMWPGTFVEGMDFRYCRVGDDPFGGHPACRCPCLTGFPDPDCMVIEQRSRQEAPSGFEVCTGVPVHRAAAVECVGRAAPACEVDDGTCRTDDDCADGQRCATDYSSWSCGCITPCTTDDDCGPGQACICPTLWGVPGGLAQCRPVDCRTDADCAEGEVCAVSQAPGPERCIFDRLACRRAQDFCDGVQCKPDEYCAYDGAGSWVCREGCDD